MIISFFSKPSSFILAIKMCIRDRDDKFCEKMTDYILFKNLDGKYMTLPDCLEVNKVDPDEAENSAVDENGEKVEAEVVEEEASSEEGENSEEEKKDCLLYTSRCV